MKIAYILRQAPHCIRSTKECNSLVRAGHDVTFIGWDIKPHESKTHNLLPSVKLSVLKYDTEYGKFQYKGWFLWYKHLIKNLFKEHFDDIHCADEYPLLMLLPFKHIFYDKIVLDVYDSIIKRKAKNFLFSGIFHFLRFVANFFSDRIIETSNELKNTLGIFQKKAIVIYNTPDYSHSIVDGIFPEQNDPIRIAATGCIHSGSMALHILIEVLDFFRPNEIEVICTGWLADDFAREVFVKHPCVKYQWIEKQEEYYRTLARCDLVYNVRVDSGDSYYRSLVFPNKIFDALSVGRPVLVASENWVAKWVNDNKIGFSCSYYDSKEMKEIFRRCIENRKNLINYSERSRKFFKEMYDWKIMEKRLIDLYKEFQTNT